MPVLTAGQKPLMTAMVAAHTAAEAQSILANSLWNGAEAFYIQLELLRTEDRNKQSLHALFEKAEGRPVIITAYRGGPVEMTDSERAELLLLGLESGASVCDLMGDLYAPSPNQLTEDANAIMKQNALIKKIHRLGGEVLMSSHLPAFTPAEELVRMAREQEKRGADILKLVNHCDSPEELRDNINAIFMLKNEVSKPFLLLTSGSHGRFLRLTGPALGVCMYLTVDRFTPLDFPQQPKLERARALREVLFV